MIKLEADTFKAPAGSPPTVPPATQVPAGGEKKSQDLPRTHPCATWMAGMRVAGKGTTR